LSAAAAGPAATAELPLFPLRLVLFPGARLQLKVFETRYLDLVSRCLRGGSGFGVVCLSAGGEVRDAARPVSFEPAGTLARIDEVDAVQPGLLQLRASGTRRFALAGAARQQADGLWLAPVHWLPDDEALAPAAELAASVQALAQAIAALAAQGLHPFDAPLRLDDAGWVANRWCELLPLPLATRHKLMLLPDPQARLRLVDGFLRRSGVVGG
jgi:Lon protease-like protein